MKLRSKDKRKIFPRHLVNQQITFEKVLLKGDGNEQTSEIVSKEEALKRAQQEQKDLFCLRLPDPAKQTLAVCKIIDYQKYLYELKKKPKVKKTVLKKIELTYHVDKEDEKTKLG
jgi:translation initiation factor IF-3